MTQTDHPLAKLRREQGIKSQRELAEAAGVTTGTIQRIESGAKLSSSMSLFKIAKALDVEVTDIVEDGQHLFLAELLAEGSR